MAINVFEKELYVNDCGRGQCGSSFRYGPTMRGYYLIHIVASGCGVYKNELIRREIHSGQGFIIYPDDVSIYEADATTPWDYVWVGFNGEQARVLTDSVGLSQNNPVFDLGKYTEIVLKIAYAIYDDMSMLKDNHSAALGGLLRLMSYVAQSKYDASEQRAVFAGKDSYERAMWDLNTNYMRSDFLISDVASSVGLSRSQLFRVFKAHTGHSPQSALSELRFSRAKQLLSSSDLPLEEIASLSGFSSVARLCEVFRNNLAITPTDFRRREKLKRSK